MKNLKKYIVFTLILLSTSALFFACSNENEAVDYKKVDNPSVTAASTERTGAMTCYISGPTVTNPNTDNALSTVNAGSVTTYQYNSTPTASNIEWNIVSGSGISIIGSATNATVTIAFSSDFNGGSIQAVGTDSSGQYCAPIIPIIKSNDSGCSCLPLLKMRFINNNGTIAGSTRGEFWFESATACNFNWSNVSNIKLQLGGEFGVGSNSTVVINTNTYNNWTNTATSPAFKNMRILTNNNTTSNVPAPGGLFNCPNWIPGSSIEGWATITYKNGCPSQTIYAVFPNFEE